HVSPAPNPTHRAEARSAGQNHDGRRRRPAWTMDDSRSRRSSASRLGNGSDMRLLLEVLTHGRLPWIEQLPALRVACCADPNRSCCGGSGALGVVPDAPRRPRDPVAVGWRGTPRLAACSARRSDRSSRTHTQSGSCRTCRRRGASVCSDAARGCPNTSDWGTVQTWGSSLGISGLSAPTLPRRGRYSAPLAGTGGTGRPDFACSRWEVEPDRAIVEEERGPAPTPTP